MPGLEEIGLTGLFIGTFLAATIFPFSSDALYIGSLAAGFTPMAVFAVGTLGNWLGGITTYYIGRIGKWEWLEKYFHVKSETLEKQKRFIDKYGVWVALISWVPFVGDVFVVALGFYKCPALWTILLMLVGKAARFAAWTFLIA